MGERRSQFCIVLHFASGYSIVSFNLTLTTDLQILGVPFWVTAFSLMLSPVSPNNSLTRYNATY